MDGFVSRERSRVCFKVTRRSRPGGGDRACLLSFPEQTNSPSFFCVWRSRRRHGRVGIESIQGGRYQPRQVEPPFKVRLPAPVRPFESRPRSHSTGGGDQWAHSTPYLTQLARLQRSTNLRGDLWSAAGALRAQEEGHREQRRGDDRPIVPAHPMLAEQKEGRRWWNVPWGTQQVKPGREEAESGGGGWRFGGDRCRKAAEETGTGRPAHDIQPGKVAPDDRTRAQGVVSGRSTRCVWQEE